MKSILSSSFNDADKKCETLPAKVKIERWPISDPEHPAADTARH